MNIILSNRRKYMRNRTNPEGAPASIADCVVTLAQDSYPYTGQPITPQVTVTYNGATLVVNTDYVLSYADSQGSSQGAVAVGAATVTVTAKEDSEFVGSQIKTFQITSASPQPTSWNFDITKTTLLATLGSVSARNLCIGSDDSEIIVLTSNGTFIKYKIPVGGNISNVIEDSRSSAVGVNMFDMSNDGSKVFVGKYVSSGTWGKYNLNLWKIELSTPYDISTLSSSSISGDPDFLIYTDSSSSGGILRISNDGMNMYVDANNTKRYSLSSAYDLTGATFKESASSAILLENGSQYLVGIDISPDGNKVLATQASSKTFMSSLGTSYVLGTAEKIGYFTGFSWNGRVRVNKSASKLYLLDGSADSFIKEYTLSA